MTDSAPALIRLQLALEGITFDAAGRLVRLPAADAEEIPRLYVARHAAGIERFYRTDLPDVVYRRLAALPPEVAFTNLELIKAILRDDAPCVDVWQGTSYVFPSLPTPANFPNVVRLCAADRERIARFDHDLLRFRSPIYAILVDGEIAATCVSARENATAAEAWVQTAPAFRRRGFARQVTAAWGHDVLAAGKVAFYSHRWDNYPSRGVATSLGLRPFVDGVGYL